MALTARSIVTLAKLKLYLGASANADVDTTLETWIDLVSGSIEEYCQCKFQPIQITGEILDGSGYWYLEPRFSPIVSTSIAATTDIQYRDQGAPTTWIDLVDSINDIYVDTVMPWRIELIEGDYFPKGTKNIKLNYIAGYTTMPADVEKVCMEMVQKMWDESKSGGDRLGVASENVQSIAGGAGSRTYENISAQHKQVLNRFRRIL